MSRWGSLCCWLACLSASSSFAEVTRWDIQSKEPYANGRSFGERGPYERWRGTVHFALDPRAAANQRVIDLGLARTNAEGLVEFSTDFEILAPKDLTKARGTILYDVNNRGNRIAPNMYNGGADEFLARHGFIVIWSGWIAELLPGDDRLLLFAPKAEGERGPITGIVRQEMAPDAPVARMPISHRPGHGSYEPTEQGEKNATLTWRMRDSDPRAPIPRAQWKLEREWITLNNVRSQLPKIDLVLAGGFRPGYLYELIYEAQDPLVQGTGLAGIRDLISCVRYDRSAKNPLRLPDGTPVAKTTVGFGVSQSGRCLRQFLYDGFNADEQGRQVFAGVIPHVSGGGLCFVNHRFAQPTRHNTQHDNHSYPVDQFPFTYGTDRDPFTGREESLLDRARAANVVPKIFQTQSSSEYWHRAGSLVHTNPEGTRDSDVPPEVRIYIFGGAQHGPGSGTPGEATTGQLPANPLDYRPFNRGLLFALESWILDGREPPASVYPRLERGELADFHSDKSGWQPLPGIRYPDVLHQPASWDRGPDFLSYRRITIEPPIAKGLFGAKVPAYGPENQEKGTLSAPAVAVPVATYTSWNLRGRQIGSENELLSLSGSYIPWPRTAAEKQATGDPRPAVRQKYPTFADYRTQYLAVARQLIADRYFLAEELPALEAAVEKLKPLWDGP